jgi:hypothetical protein
MVGLQFGPYCTAFNEFSKFYSVAINTHKYRANKSNRITIANSHSLNFVSDSLPKVNKQLHT